jgi:hypothetical protein
VPLDVTARALESKNIENNSTSSTTAATTTSSSSVATTAIPSLLFEWPRVRFPVATTFPIVRTKVVSVDKIMWGDATDLQSTLNLTYIEQLTDIG